MFKTLLKICLFYGALFYWSNEAYAQTLYKYVDSSGSITYTSRKPVGKAHSVVKAQTPVKSVFIQRGLGYKWSAKPKPSAYDEEIILLSKQYKLDPALVKAVIHIESAFNSSAVSSAGARGLMQLMPATARRFGVKNSYDPLENMLGGVQYLRWLFERFNGNVRFVLAGYNAGEGAVDRHKGIPPYRETQDYVKKVIKMAELYRNDFSGSEKKDTKRKDTMRSVNTTRARLK